ncbi:GxxExxY protein [bacterium]|nr:GxxExxY protein [bacterium]
MDTDALTSRIIGCAMTISRELGCGFLESVYRRALGHSLSKTGLLVEPERRFTVVYDGVVVGEYRADLVIGGQVIVEVKALRAIEPAHHAQLLNYLKAARLRVGLLLNFGTPRLGIKRMVM